jgi:hypothetical protein
MAATITLDRTRTIGSTEIRVGPLGFEAVALDTVAALQVPLHHPAVVTVIPGSRSRAEAERNVQPMTEVIPLDFRCDLQAEGRSGAML